MDEKKKKTTLRDMMSLIEQAPTLKNGAKSTIQDEHKWSSIFVDEDEYDEESLP